MYQINEKVRFKPNGRKYTVAHITPESNATPAVERVIYLQQNSPWPFNKGELMAVPFALAESMIERL